MAIVTCLSCCLVAAFALITWHLRERLDAYLAVQILVVVAFLTTINVFISLQFLSNPATRAFAQWSPWVWCLLLLFPLISLRFWWMRRSFEREMVNRQIDVTQRN